MAQTQPFTIDSRFLSDVVHGLSAHPKELDCKYFYDERGSQLFDQICELDEYYLTRTELAIMDRYVDEMAFQIGSRVMLVEFGSGSSVKTRKLLDSLEDPVAYVPIDISEDHLLKTARVLRQRYPQIEILPLVTDFTQGLELPESRLQPSHAAVYFPGSTIGNFTPEQARQMLVNIADVLGPQGGLLIGIDLQKDPSIIHDAYNDKKGVTAEFNLNVLRRINQELGGNFVLDQFEHQAIYDPTHARVEISVISRVHQVVEIQGQMFTFDAGEKIKTEYSHKYSIDGFAILAAEAQFRLHKAWTDENQMFAVLHLVNEKSESSQP